MHHELGPIDDLINLIHSNELSRHIYLGLTILTIMICGIYVSYSITFAKNYFENRGKERNQRITSLNNDVKNYLKRIV